MGETAIAPLARLLGLQDRILEEIIFRNAPLPDDLPEEIRRIL